MCSRNTRQSGSLHSEDAAPSKATLSNRYPHQPWMIVKKSEGANWNKKIRIFGHISHIQLTHKSQKTKSLTCRRHEFFLPYDPYRWTGAQKTRRRNQSINYIEVWPIDFYGLGGQPELVIAKKSFRKFICVLKIAKSDGFVFVLFVVNPWLPFLFLE